MAEEEHSRGATGAVRPGALTALLRELAASPAPGAGGEEWQSGLRAGAVVGRFELVRELGRGGFGVVWEGRDRELGRRVAFKAVRAGAGRDLREERLLREAEAAARLSHPNIVTLYDVGRWEHGPYLVLELLEGTTLAERLGLGALPVREAVRIATEIAKGLAHAHAQGVVHRDLKPENVFLCADGQVKVLDLGLAHAFGRRRVDGGTLAYMAPEQLEGGPEDERTDVFALGVILYEMLAGRRPFEDERALRSRSEAPGLEVPDEPALERVLARALEKAPARRLRDGAEVLAALSALRLELERSTAPSARVRRPRIPRPRAALVIAAALAVAVAGGLLAARLRVRPPPAGADGRVVVAVADFANETGERELDALSGLLITALEQSPRLSVLPRGRLFDLAREAGHRDVRRIDEVIGRDVSRRAGVRALLAATVHRLGTTYAVELRALDPVKDEYLFTAKEAVAGKEAIFGLLDRLAGRARAELRGSGEEARASGASSTGVLTTSLEAYEHYFRGQELDDRLELQAAVEEYRKALAKDPRFALAHYALSVDLKQLGASDGERRAHAEAAVLRAEQMPEKEGLLARAWLARSRWRFDEMREAYGLAVERYPHDKRSLVLAGQGELYCWFDAESARRLGRRAVALDPSFQPARDLLLLATVNAGLWDEALDLAREWARAHPSETATEWLSLVHILRGEPDAALRALDGGEGGDRVERSSDSARAARALIHAMRDELDRAEAELGPLRPSEPHHVVAFRTDLALYRGRPREAERIRTRAAGIELSRRAILRSRFEHLAGQGAGPALRAAARELRAYSENIDPLVAVVLALAGEVELADEVARGWTGPGAREFVDAMRLRVSGDLAGARRALEALGPRPPLFRRQAAAFALGETCQLAGDDRCALEAFREFRWLRDPGWGLEARAWAYPRSLLLAARSQERLGDVAAARETVDRLLALWKDAEPDFPPLAEARALRSRLAAAPVGPRAAAPPASIAVLPFADLSPGKDQEYLSDGIAEEILNALTRVEGLRVVGRTSSFSFKGKKADLPTMGRKLGVATLLEGSVRRDGDRVRISARLVKAADGYGIWSEAYDVKLTGMLELQDEIARAVASGLRVELVQRARAGPPPRGASADAPTDRRRDPVAYAELLRGRYLIRRMTEEDSNLAIQVLERAVALDPGSAELHAALSWAYLVAPNLIGTNPDRPNAVKERDAMQDKARREAERAIALRPDLPDGYIARAACRHFAFDWSGARADLEKALALAPRSVEARARHAELLATLGRLGEAIRATRAVLEDDPLAAFHAWSLASYYNATGRHALARGELSRALEVAPDHLRAIRELCFTELLEGRPEAALATAERSKTWWVRSTVRAMAHHSLGREAESRQAIAELERQRGRLAYQLAQVHAWRGEPDLAFRWLEHALEVRDEGLVYVTYDPMLRALREDPRYPAFLRKANLPAG